MNTHELFLKFLTSLRDAVASGGSAKEDIDVLEPIIDDLVTSILKDEKDAQRWRELNTAIDSAAMKSLWNSRRVM